MRHVARVVSFPVVSYLFGTHEARQGGGGHRRHQKQLHGSRMLQLLLRYYNRLLLLPFWQVKSVHTQRFESQYTHQEDLHFEERKWIPRSSGYGQLGLKKTAMTFADSPGCQAFVELNRIDQLSIISTAQ
jgi:hypothetical protein